MSSLELHIEDYGAGEPTIVLMHGFAGSARNLRPQARFLASRHRVVAFDLRGHARSPLPSNDAANEASYSADAFVGDARAVIAKTGSRSVVLGGISMGSAIALRYALRFPDSLRGLVLASFPPPASASSPPWALSFADSIDHDGLEAAGERFVWGGERYDAAAARWIRQGFLEHSPRALSSVLRQFLALHPGVAELAPELARVRVPTLVIAGERDLPSREPSRALAAAIPGAELAIVADAGHVVNLEKPKEFNAVLGDFLSRIERT